MILCKDDHRYGLQFKGSQGVSEQLQNRAECSIESGGVCALSRDVFFSRA